MATLVSVIQRESSAPNRLDWLDGLFKRYPDVNKEVVCKCDLQREGVLVTEAAADLSQGMVVKTYQLFSWDMTPVDKQVKSQAVRMPDMVYGFGGLYNLRRTAFRPRANINSPYLLDVYEGEPWILDRATRTPLVQLERWYKGSPEWHFKTFADGSAFTEYTVHTVFRQCQYWGPEEECKFCDINENGRTKKMLGQVQSIQPRDPARIADVEWSRLYLREDDKEYPKKSGGYGVGMTGGAITGKLRGMTEWEYYSSYVEALRARFGGRLHVYLNMEPRPIAIEKRYKEAGIDSRSSNFEVWDPQMFEVICPGKARNIGRDEWVRRLINQVEVFGWGNVNPGFVSGVEMAQPWGFRTEEDAVASTTAGLDFLMRHGVIPRPIQWCVEALSALAGQQEPPVDYFIQMERNYWYLYEKYSLPPQHWGAIGPGRNTHHQNSAWDMEWVVEGR